MRPKTVPKKRYKGKSTEKNKHLNELMGIMMFALGLIVFLSLYFDNSIGFVGAYIKEILLALTGAAGFVFPIVMMVYSSFMIFKKDIQKANLRAVYSMFLILLISAMLQTTYHNHANYENLGFFKTLQEIAHEGMDFYGGGILGGIISIPFMYAFGKLGTVILLSAFLIIDFILVTNISVASLLQKMKNALKNIFSQIFLEDGEDNLDMEPKKANIKQEKEKRSKKTFKKHKSEVNDVLPIEPQINIGGVVANDNNIEEVKLYDVSDEVKEQKEGIKLDKVLEEKISESTMSGNKFPNYQYPSIDLLNTNQDGSQNLKELKKSAIDGAKKLEETLKNFGVEARVINVTRGPAITRYELQPSAGVKVSKIVSLSDDISLNLAAMGIRIEAPIPGKAAIGIEIPNKEVTPVLLREVIESPDFSNYDSKLAFAVGKDISGQNIVTDIAKMPHVLIAGATGAGKSVCINSLIMSILYKASPDEVKLLMVDPKVVELGIYNGIPHLLIPVVTDSKKAAGALNWAVQEMVNRYKLFADKGVRDIKGYNQSMKDSEEEDFLPQIVIIIDELADLMMVAPNDVEDSICRLAQMARAAGMHLVIATQRPSVDVITGVIKANVPSRISFAVSSQVDSRTILDMVGAEKLLGKGDMLFYPIGQAKPIRVKGAFVSDKEVERVVEFVKSQANTEYDENIIEEINNKDSVEEFKPGDNDELLPQAIELVVELGQASVSLIQRKFKVGYARAARIVDQMEARGIVGPFDGSKPRSIMITKQQWNEMQMAGNR